MFQVTLRARCRRRSPTRSWCSRDGVGDHDALALAFPVFEYDSV